jgi:hypothetical protein
MPILSMPNGGLSHGFMMSGSENTGGYRAHAH